MGELRRDSRFYKALCWCSIATRGNPANEEANVGIAFRLQLEKCKKYADDGVMKIPESSGQKKNLAVWIINTYANLPGEGWRDHRSTLIANALAEAGHSTVWWVSNFEHRSKTFRSPDWKDIQLNPNVLIRVVPSTSYTSHISLRRIRYEQTFARRLYQRAVLCDPPDIIVLSEPALFVSPFVLKLLKHWQTTLIVDIIDLWPELFHIALPARLSKIGRLIFFPFYMRRAALFRRADAIVAVSSDYLDVAQKSYTKNLSEVIYWGVDVSSIQAGMLASDDLPEALRYRAKSPGESWAIYAGTLGNNYDIRTILLAAEMLQAQDCPVTILIAGEGPLKREVLATIESKNLKNVIYVGNLSAPTVTRLYGFCDIALSTYVSGSTVSMPIKAYDYMAAGLPIVNSLDRELGSIVVEKNIGMQYTSQDPVSLFHAIQKLAQNPQIRHSMSENAKGLALSFDARSQYRKFVKIVEKVARDS